MKKQKIALWISLLTFGLFFVLRVQTFAEVIKSFDAKITVNTDASVSVVETIVYDSEELEKHGIFRDIRTTSSKGKEMAIKDISVANIDGTYIQWQKQQNNEDIRLKIGDTDVTFAGVKTYVISYKATNAVAHLENNIDEIYWNVTGNAWSFNIEKATARVFIPEGAGALQQSCYGGLEGMNLPCDIGNDEGVFSRSNLGVGGGMTVAVGFPSGFIFEHAPTFKEKVIDFLNKFWPLLIPLVTFIFMFRKWYRKGRDAKGKGTVVAQYEVVDNLTPLEASVIINQKFNGKDIIAEILYLATEGYIAIERVVEKRFIGKNVDYVLTLKKLPDESPNLFDRQLLKEIFSGDNLSIGKTVKLSQNHTVHSIINSLNTDIKKRLVENGYYTNDFITEPFYTKLYNKKFITVFVVLAMLVSFFGSFLVNFVVNNLGNIQIFLLIASIIVSIIIKNIFDSIMPAKTQKGALVKEHLLGLNEYIKVAEKDRIAFHNAPEMNATLFEKLLPYAVMFGLEKKWAKAFEGITLPPPSWYSSNSSSFVPALFVADFSDNFSSSFFTAPTSSSGGSGGGGFSGGGGGGGGGGSW